jgi:hypothetical protein
LNNITSFERKKRQKRLINKTSDQPDDYDINEFEIRKQNTQKDKDRYIVKEDIVSDSSILKNSNKLNDNENIKTKLTEENNVLSREIKNELNKQKIPRLATE